MLLFTPQVQLFYYPVIDLEATDSSVEYILHAVTFCDRTSYRAAGHQLHNAEPDVDGQITVDLLIQEDAELPGVSSLTPIVHTINLGEIPFAGEGAFVTQVVVQDALAGRGSDSSSTTKGKTTSSTTSAKEVDRPIGGL